jgi:predicted RNA binding protein YcfA (HicA-like mRNA interferase family)
MKIKDLIDMIELDGWQQVRQKAAIVNFTIPSNPVRSQLLANPAWTFYPERLLVF